MFCIRPFIFEHSVYMRIIRDKSQVKKGAHISSVRMRKIQKIEREENAHTYKYLFKFEQV